MHLTRLVYYSEAQIDDLGGSRLGSLQDLLETSQRNNARRGLTGALACDGLWFFQALEGMREDVWATFKTIMEDTRHGAVTVAAFMPVEARCFGAWSMRLVMRSTATDQLLQPFKIGGVVRPERMSHTDIVDVLRSMADGGDKAAPARQTSRRAIVAT